ncbi:Glutaminase [Bacillus sp. T2.9-1]|nr:Glutaminase [Bacillus sp. T2.9-1]
MYAKICSKVGEKMPCQSNEELENILLEAKQYASKGKVADYIPALSKANPADLSVAIYHSDGTCYSAGCIHKKITLQSISKVITLALALIESGEEFVFSKVGYEPTGDPFNSIVKLEMSNPSKPLNPMINAGALAVTHMIKGSSVEERFQKIIDFVKLLSGNQEISYSKEVAKSEFETSHLNRALCFFMKQHSIINEDVEELLDLYTKQCSIEVNCLDLARIGIVFALDGKEPITNKQLMPSSIARICKTFMVTCGMYNASGEFAVRVGIPAKSGVSGGILGAVPARFGIGISGPALDDKGNSVAGLKLLEILAKKYDLSMF